MKPSHIAVSALLLSLSPLTPTHAAVVGQNCQDDYIYDYYGNAELVSTTCTTDYAYTLQGTAVLRSPTSGDTGMTFDLTGTMTRQAWTTDDYYNGQTYGGISTFLTFGVSGLGTYSMTRTDETFLTDLYIGPVSNSISDSTFTTDSTTTWFLQSDDLTALVRTLDGDSDGIDGFNVYLDGALYAVADVQMTTVPVPAAVWLMGSGLLGLLGFGRRTA